MKADTTHTMNSLLAQPLRKFVLAVSLGTALSAGTAAWGKPSIQSLEVSPNPLIIGGDFTITVAASPDVETASATVAFPGTPGANKGGPPRSLEVPLNKQGQVWIGSGLVPADSQAANQGPAQAKVTALVFDANHGRAQTQLHVDIVAPSVSAVFVGGILTVTGDNQDNTLVVSRDPAGTLIVNGGTIPISGGPATVANTSLVRIFGFGGNDTLTMDEANGPLPPANLFGGEGDDVLTGSSSGDVLDGGPGNDTLVGRAGNDLLRGGTGNDILNGGQGSDTILAGEGDDQIVWNPGDGSDVIEGQGGNDVLVFNGANISETVQLVATGGRLHFVRDVANITLDCDGVGQVIFRALGGADKVIVNDLTGTTVTQVMVNLLAATSTGDAQADTVTVMGTDGNDLLTVTDTDAGVVVSGLHATVAIVGGEPGLDQLFMDMLGGVDAVDFIGSEDNEVVDLSADGARLRFSRDVANMLVECTGVEQVSYHSLGGTDTIAVNDLTGTQVTNVVVDLSGTNNAPDGFTDTLNINGTAGDDHLTIVPSAAGIEILGLTASVSILGADPNLDQLVINTLTGADAVDASAVPAGVINLTLSGGPGDDLLVGSQENDVLIGGQGNDVLFGGPGDDTFVWNPGDGSDIIEGQAGQDTLVFNGANIGEIVEFSANGQRLNLSRNVGNILLDCDGLETIELAARGGSDSVTIDDLTGTSVTRIDLDLAGISGSGVGDNQADLVSINGTAGNDVVHISGTPGAGGAVVGLAVTVNIAGTDPALDQLVVKALEGDDLVEATGLQAGVISLTIDGGPGDDVLIGSAGADVLLGDLGDDVLEGGPGNDILDGGPGSNILIQ
jgi:Ca2+-binding RTX toxin-like protein